MLNVTIYEAARDYAVIEASTNREAHFAATALRACGVGMVTPSHMITERVITSDAFDAGTMAAVTATVRWLEMMYLTVGTTVEFWD